MFGARRLFVDEKVLLMKKDLAHMCFFDNHHVSISVQINLDTMLKNKRLIFDI